MARTSLQDLLKLHDQSAIVTGAGKGIGRAIAYRLAEAGAKVLVADMDEDSANQTAQKLRDNGWVAKAAVVDVSNEADVQRMIAHCRDNFGSVDILVNNAGIYPPVPLIDMTEEDFERVMHVNLRSVFLTTKHAAGIMKQQKKGKIINITSVDALHPSMIGLAHYDASKHGVWGFTKNSALELAPYNIWVNAIAPGGIQTPGVEAMQAAGNEPSSDTDQQQMIEKFLSKIPMHRMGEADEIGTVALFLASPMASYMTGEQIVVDGGVLLS